MIAVTGFKEAIEVLRNKEDFSSVIAPGGPVPALPFEAKGDDISSLIEAHYQKIPGGELLVSLDDNRHAASRAILNRLFTPSRLRANENYMHTFARQLVGDVVAKGQCELINDVAVPFVTLVIADLLGVPEADRDLFMDVISVAPPPGNLNLDVDPLKQENAAANPLEYMAGFFYRYVVERRTMPSEDVLTELATAKFPDGSTPDVAEIVRLATFLFAAGQDTSAKLLGNAMRFMLEVPGLEQQLRSDQDLIPAFLEEVLRLEGSSKVTARLARKATKIGAFEVPAGKKVMVALAAANRDPGKGDNPETFTPNREKIKEHVAFGRGAHTCSGAPLASAELRVIFECFLDITSEILVSEKHHGPFEDRKLEYEQSFIIRGLSQLHLELKPA